MSGERIDITRDFERSERRRRRKERRERFFAWCDDHKEAVFTGFCAGLGLVTTAVKVGGKMYKQRMEYKDKDLRCYDPSLGRYWNLKRPLSNSDWLEIDRRKSAGERMGDILDSLNALK